MSHAPNLGDLTYEYAERSMMPELHPFKPDIAMYEALGDAGHIVTFTAHIDGVLIGFLLLAVTPVLHYSRPVPSIESLFVKSSTSAYAGPYLLALAKRWARDRGYPLLLASAQVGTDAHAFYTANKHCTERSTVFGFPL